MSADEQRELFNMTTYIYQQLGPWPQLGQNAQGQDLTLVDAVAAIKTEAGKE